MIRKHRNVTTVVTAAGLLAIAGLRLTRLAHAASAPEATSEQYACGFCIEGGHLYSLGAVVPSTPLSQRASALLTCRVRGWVNSTGRVVAPQPQEAVGVGARLTRLNVADAQGQAHTLQLEGSSLPTVLYFYVTGCPWCNQNQENLGTLAKAIRDRYRVVALSLVSLSPPEDPAGQAKVPVYRLLSTMGGPLGLHIAPETVVVSPGGTVLEDWVGAYTGQVLAEVESYFGVKLPGIAQ